MKYCSKFFTHLEVSLDGSCWLCCPAWLPTKIGNILEDEFEDMWNGPLAQNIRNQIYSEEWNYCNAEFCPVIAQDMLRNTEDIDNHIHIPKYVRNAIKKQKTKIQQLPYTINFSEDESCNLQCPSCRVTKILHNRDSEQYKKKKRINDKIYELFLRYPTKREFELNVTGSGDPFASIIYREMLESLNGSEFPNMIINLTTNGVLFTEKNWNRISKIHKNLKNCRISLDAGTKETYETKTRLGGKWDVLMENCKFLNDRVPELEKFHLHFDFVVQYDNYLEMKDYIELVLTKFPNASSIHFNKVTNWKTWSHEQFKQKAIWMEDHPDHQKFIDVLKDNIFDHKKVWLGNLYPYRES
jgi:hypothetical protein